MGTRGVDMELEMSVLKVSCWFGGAGLASVMSPVVVFGGGSGVALCNGFEVFDVEVRTNFCDIIDGLLVVVWSNGICDCESIHDFDSGFLGMFKTKRVL